VTWSNSGVSVVASYEELQSLPRLMEAVRRPPLPERGSELHARGALLYPDLALLLVAQSPRSVYCDEWEPVRACRSPIGLGPDRWRLAHPGLLRGTLGESATGTRRLFGFRGCLAMFSKQLRRYAQKQDSRLRSCPQVQTTSWRWDGYSLPRVGRLWLARVRSVTQARPGDVQERRGRFGTALTFLPPVRWPHSP
jgi:hypothetical protein